MTQSTIIFPGDVTQIEIPFPKQDSWTEDWSDATFLNH